MEIKQVENINDKKYLDFVESNGGVFNSAAWLNMYGKQLQVMSIEHDNRIVGAFNQWLTKKPGNTFYRTPPMMPNNGLTMQMKASNASNMLSESKVMMELMADYYLKKSKGLVSIVFPPEIKDMQPFAWRQFKVVSGYTYRMPLHFAQEVMEARMSTTHRNAMKSAVKDGLRSELTHEYSIVESLVNKTFERKEKRSNVVLVKKILYQFANDANSFSYITWQGEKPVSGTFCLVDKDIVYYIMGGYDQQLKHNGAGILSLFNSILHAKQLGKSFFDFEGSMLPEVEKYFRGFGAELTPYFTVNKANLALEMLMKLKQRSKF
ncbi:MAG: GNAT family N-acetyltransferase [Flavobacteriales bacterium]